MDDMRRSALDKRATLLTETRETVEKVLIVPHIGGNTRESFERTEVFLAQKVIEGLQAAATPSPSTASS
jgi:phosphoglycerate dehydrogenase-like enzyme